MGKRKNGEGTYSCVKGRPNTWMGRVTINGKRYTIYTRAENEKKAIEELQERIVTMRKGECISYNSMSVAEWVEAWQQIYLPSMKETTREKYQADMRRYILPRLGGKKLTELRQIHIQSVCNQLGKSLSAKTVSNVVNTFHEVLKYAQQNRYISENPCTNIKIEKEKKPEMNYLREDEISKFMKAAEGDRYRTPFYIDLSTGLRAGELLGLTWDCIDFEKKTIHVYRQLTYSKEKQAHTFTSTKTGAERTFNVNDGVINALKEIRQQQEKWKTIYGKEWKDQHGLVFTHEDGENYSRQTLYHHLKKIMGKIGRPEMRMHDLRHTYATMVIQGGGNIKALSQALGHSSVSITMDRYTHTTAPMMEQNADIISGFVKME